MMGGPATSDDYVGARLNDRYMPLGDGRFWVFVCERCGAVGKSEGPYRIVNNFRAHKRRCPGRPA